MEYIIEAADPYDRWGIVDYNSRPAQFLTRRMAEAVMAHLIENGDFDADCLRVRAIPSDDPTRRVH